MLVTHAKEQLVTLPQAPQPQEVCGFWPSVTLGYSIFAIINEPGLLLECFVWSREQQALNPATAPLLPSPMFPKPDPGYASNPSEKPPSAKVTIGQQDLENALHAGSSTIWFTLHSPFPVCK